MSQFRLVIIIYLTALFYVTATTSVAAVPRESILTGTVTDAESGETLPFASVTVDGSDNGTMTDSEGRFSLLLSDGKQTLTVSYIGYTPATISVTLPLRNPLTVTLSRSTRLGEVVVTARESSSATSASRIDRAAMEHLQPTSFTDLLELLPGNMSKTPDMGAANTITLRETGTVTATGARVETAGNYAITSLGTLFVVDGAPLNNDASLQSLPGGSSTVDSDRDMTNRGVDMRTISTDNIESVEIVRGIPSAEYGNLTSGMVNIRRIRRQTPVTARFKADEYSKLFSVGKGFSVGARGDILNADAGYLDSKVDPRDNLENYKRINGSVRWNMTRGENRAVTTRLNIGADYTGSFDNAKTDPDLNYHKVDEYRSSYNRWALTSELRLGLNRCSFLNTLSANVSASYERDRLERRRQMMPQRTSIAPTTMEPGVHDGRYLSGEYLAELTVDGQPFTLFLKGVARGEKAWDNWLHNYKAGLEWSLAKNFGRGQIYDLERPLSTSWVTRPRAFSDIPALKTLSAYIEDDITTMVGATELNLQIGLRSSALTGLDRRYRLSGRLHLDPRANAVVTLPSFEGLRLHIAGGFGLTTKLPTSDYLFPQVCYSDLIQLSYYDVNNPREFSRVSLMTYIDDPTNYDLRAARNRKWEVRVGGTWRGNSFSVTYFDERLTSGFRYSTLYVPRDYRRYDASAVNSAELTGPPSLEDLPFEERTVLDGMSRVSNGSKILKRGIEFQLSTSRWDLLRTSLTFTGAWFHTTYSNSQRLYQAVSQVVGGEAVADRYVGLYNVDDGRTNDQFNTNLMFDTQIPQWGLIFTTSIQAMWWVRTRQMWRSGVPESYLSTDGQLHPYTDADRSDPVRQFLTVNYNSSQFDWLTIRPACYLNLKATKRIGRWITISAYVNRIFDYLPKYRNNGLLVRRSSSPYFGMEATLTI
ncbi:MAG: TonB-dependent receptor [Clostridium sp.]|nr:TonB-dependent receptor [Clostridium sp.]